MVHWPKPNKPWVLIFAQIIRDRKSTKMAKMMVLCWLLTLIQQGQICFCMHLYRPYTCIWENVENSYFEHLLYNPFEWKLDDELWRLSRHKIPKWADRKSMMAATAAILKINFRRLFPKLWSLWAKTRSAATGWLLDQNKIKLCQSEIQDGPDGSTPLNKTATRA